jgi:uncharacterized damage-inducible protein DinB
MTIRQIRELFSYDLWATDAILVPVASVSEDLYLKDLKSSHGGIHGTLVHIYAANMIWLRRWRGSSAGVSTNPEDTTNLESLKARLRDYWIDVENYLKGLDEKALGSPFSYMDLRGNPQSEPMYQQMQHLVNHSSYHRGQVVTMLRQIGAVPVRTDLIAYYRLKAHPSEG